MLGLGAASRIHVARAAALNTCALYKMEAFQRRSFERGRVHVRQFRSSGLLLDKKRDYYEVLGLERGASASDVKKAYYKLAKKVHPDTNDGDAEAEQQFAELGEAYEVLKDTEKRQLYDQFGHAGVDPNNTQGGFGGGGFRGAEDIFADLFGGGMRRGPRPGADVQVGLRLTFMEAIKGCQKPVTVNTMENCETCSCSGCRPGTTPEVCAQCKGTGMETVSTGFFQMQTGCRRCGGTGKIIVSPCVTCGGEGEVQVGNNITVTVPEGVDTGVNIRLAGQGEKGQAGAPRGNLFVTIQVGPHETFQRQGVDIHIKVPIDVGTAVLGGKVSIPTLDEVETMKVSPGTQPGQVMTLSQYGVKRLNSNSKGDLHAHLMVKIPRRLTPEQRELMEQFQALEEGKRNTVVPSSDSAE